MKHSLRVWSALATCFLACAAEGVHGEQVRFRFVPIDANGSMSQVPAGPNGALGDQSNGL